MKVLSYIAFSFIVLVSSTVHAQSYFTKNKKAIQYYEQAEMYASPRARQFDAAIELLHKALKKDPEFVDAYLKLGGIHKLFKREDLAFQNFKKACELQPENRRLHGAYMTLAYMYYRQEDYNNAKKYFEKGRDYPSVNLYSNSDAAFMLESCDFAIEAIKKPLSFKPVKMESSINYRRSQAYPCLTADESQMILTVYSSDKGKFNENIEISTKENGRWTKPKSISDTLNTMENEGTASISADGRTLVFTACNRKNGMGSCDIYISTKEGGTWSSAINLGPNVNSKSWESEATLSADGQTIYFTSRRGSKPGKENLFVTHKEKDGTWAKARGVSEHINNERSQVSPFIHADGKTLFFASNGYPGMGGYDLFKSIKTDTGWSKPINLGYPLNTAKDESTIHITANYETGYFAKVDNNTRRREDISSMIYEFQTPAEIKGEKCIYAKGVVTDKVTKKCLAAEIELVDLNTGKVSQKLMSDALTGEYLVVLTEGHEYALYVKKDGYLFYSSNFNFMEEKSFDPFNLDVALQPINDGTSIVLHNIFFETGKYELLPKSKTELKKLVDLLKFNSGMKVEIGGYTDNVGSKTDNKLLSENRAKAVVQFLIKAGIDSKRIIAKGYGELHPIADNTTVKGRAKNRRIEFKVVNK